MQQNADPHQKEDSAQPLKDLGIRRVFREKGGKERQGEVSKGDPVNEEKWPNNGIFFKSKICQRIPRERKIIRNSEGYLEWKDLGEYGRGNDVKTNKLHQERGERKK